MNQIRIVLNWILRDTSVSVNWMHLDGDAKQWWAVVGTLMNLRAPQNVDRLLASQEQFCFLQ